MSELLLSASGVYFFFTSWVLITMSHLSRYWPNNFPLSLPNSHQLLSLTSFTSSSSPSHGLMLPWTTRHCPDSFYLFLVSKTHTHVKKGWEFQMAALELRPLPLRVFFFFFCRTFYFMVMCSHVIANGRFPTLLFFSLYLFIITSLFSLVKHKCNYFIRVLAMDYIQYN